MLLKFLSYCRISILKNPTSLRYRFCKHRYCCTISICCAAPFFTLSFFNIGCSITAEGTSVPYLYHYYHSQLNTAAMQIYHCSAFIISINHSVFSSHDFFHCQVVSGSKCCRVTVHIMKPVPPQRASGSLTSIGLKDFLHLPQQWIPQC